MLGSKAAVSTMLAAVLALGAVTACGSDDGSGTTEGDGGSSADSSESLKEVTFLTGFGFSSWEAGFAVAKEKGYYEEAGLDVELKSGQGSTSNLQLVGNGNVTFSQAGGGAIAAAVEKGVPVKAVGSVFQAGGAGIIAPPDVKSPEDMEGKSLAVPAFSFPATILPLWEKTLGISGIEHVTVDPTAIPTVFLQGKTDMMLGVSWAEVPEVEAEDAEFNFFNFEEAGLNVIGPCITVLRSTLENEPDVVEAFVEASSRGYEYVYENQDEAAEIVHELWPTTDPELDHAVIPALETAAHTEATEGDKVGWMAKSDWEHSVEVLVEAEALEKPIPIDQLYENVIEQE